MKHRLLPTILLALAAQACAYDPCPGGVVSVSGNGSLVTCSFDFDDEAGEPECGLAIFDSGVVIVSHAGCDDRVTEVIEEFALVPFALNLDPDSCKIGETWECFAPDKDVFAEPMRCGYCAEFNTITGSNTPQLCWADPASWEPATLQGRLTPLNCSLIEPAIGGELGWPLPMECPAGISCLGLDESCSCKCLDRDGIEIGYPSTASYIARWWEPFLLPDVPPLVGGDYPVEATCSGEPLVFVDNGGPPGWIGSTIELDGTEPNDPPNGQAL